ncbi:hypothetical protein BDR05DRAFT_947356 [Suillus weaverae]|nr:hypothetical protein BDR05DRAFT_947356 [Suillus weaverae]
MVQQDKVNQQHVPQPHMPSGPVPLPGGLDLQAAQLLLAALGPNAIAILSSMQAMNPMHHIPQIVPQPPALPPTPSAIDPQLKQPLQQVLQRLENLENAFKQPHSDEGDQADDEGDDKSVHYQKKARKDDKFILHVKTDQLTAAQKMTHSELQVHAYQIQLVIYNLTGIITSEIGKAKDSDDKKIVWSEQQTHKESFNLTHKDVKFNKSDILAFAKDKFRNYK